MKLANGAWIWTATVVVMMVGVTALAHAEDRIAPALRLANQRERATQARYVLDAERARTERCPQAAALFDALAAAEAVHVSRTALALDRLGVPSAPALPVAAPGTTLENLRDALAAEDFERHAAYPAFIRCAREECDYDALACLGDARAAEATHANRIALLLVRLEAAAPVEPLDAGVAYFVCPDCGRVCSQPPAGHCDCGSSGARFARYDAAAAAPRVPALIAWR